MSGATDIRIDDIERMMLEDLLQAEKIFMEARVVRLMTKVDEIGNKGPAQVRDVIDKVSIPLARLRKIPAKVRQVAEAKSKRGYKELLKGTSEQIEAQCGALEERLGELLQLGAELFSLKVLAKEARNGLGQKLAARGILVAQHSSASAMPCARTEQTENTGGAPVHGRAKAPVFNDVLYRPGFHLVAAAQSKRLEETKDCAQRSAERAKETPTDLIEPEREPKIFTAALSRWLCGATKADGLQEDLVSIIPLQVLVDALQNGFDLNADVEEIYLDKSKQVYDAPGNPMSLKGAVRLTTVTVAERLCLKSGETKDVSLCCDKMKQDGVLRSSGEILPDTEGQRAQH
ncbi:unnamed protein product [Heligmosomoides polygyrus]|uniref:SKA2 domain-containing protein n=1 Tax=Heligmosomoides polygyrus TaxID=6339 RepID=A0A183GS25_HELPZ|nr:unnamed protein product [Heligmosomoides polygyrus]